MTPYPTYSIGCAPSEDAEQTAHPHSPIRFFVEHSVGSQGSKASSGGPWSACANVHADPSLRWAHLHSFSNYCVHLICLRHSFAGQSVSNSLSESRYFHFILFIIFQWQILRYIPFRATYFFFTCTITCTYVLSVCFSSQSREKREVHSTDMYNNKLYSHSMGRPRWLSWMQTIQMKCKALYSPENNNKS